MSKKIKKIILILILVLFATKKVSAAKIELTYTYYNDEINGNYRIYKVIDGKSTFLDMITVVDGDKKIGYCIDIGSNLQTGDTTSIKYQNLEGYLTTALNDANKAKAVSKKINEYIYFGYGYNGERNSHNYYAATQKLIWDELYASGYRQNYYSNDAYLGLATGAIDLEAEYAAIKNSITKYNTKPSMCSQTEKLEISVGETATYTDSNGVLSDYSINCTSGLKCEVNGNKLTVTALENPGEQSITFTKEATGSTTVVYKEDNIQGVTVGQGNLEGISCTFGLDTYENVQTSGVKIIAIISVGIIFVLIAYLIYYKNKFLTNN